MRRKRSRHWLLTSHDGRRGTCWIRFGAEGARAYDLRTCGGEGTRFLRREDAEDANLLLGRGRPIYEADVGSGADVMVTSAKERSAGEAYLLALRNADGSLSFVRLGPEAVRVVGDEAEGTQFADEDSRTQVRHLLVGADRVFAVLRGRRPLVDVTLAASAAGTHRRAA